MSLKMPIQGVIHVHYEYGDPLISIQLIFVYAIPFRSRCLNQRAMVI